MGQREQKISSFAKVRQRDAAGHFIPVSRVEPPAVHITETTHVTSPVITDTQVVEDEAVVSIKVPLISKMYKMLDNIRRHQATTFSLKFTIPLIALPIFLLVAFQLGRAQITCVSSFSSQVGTVHVSTIQAPKKSPGFLSTMLSFFPEAAALTPATELITENRALLIAPTGQIYHIIYNQNIPMSLFEGKRVAVTGNVSACTNSIALDSAENISVLP